MSHDLGTLFPRSSRITLLQNDLVDLLRRQGRCTADELFQALLNQGWTDLGIEDVVSSLELLRFTRSTDGAFIYTAVNWDIAVFRGTVWHEPARASTHYSAGLLDAWSALLPHRIATEELGDYILDIERKREEGKRFLVAVRVLAAIFWTGVNAFGYFMKQVRKGKKSA